MKRPPSTMGFWSLQLVAVLAIMYMLVGHGDEADNPRRALALESAEHQIRAAVTRARELARITHREHGVVFDALGDRMALIQEGGTLATDPANGNTYQVDFGRPGPLEEIDILGADFGAKGPVVVFDGNGNARSGGSLTLRIRGADRILVLDQATGAFIDRR